MQYSITLHRTLFVQGWCDVLEQDRTVESSTPYGIGMLSLRNGLLQKSAFLRHIRCIELGKRYIKALASARVKQLSPGFHQTFMSCSGYILFAAEQRLGTKYHGLTYSAK